MNLDDLYVYKLANTYFILTWDGVFSQMTFRLSDFSVIDNEYITLRNKIYPIEDLPPDVYEVISDKNIIKGVLAEYLDAEIEDVQETINKDMELYNIEMAKWQNGFRELNNKIQKLASIRDSL